MVLDSSYLLDNEIKLRFRTPLRAAKFFTRNKDSVDIYKQKCLKPTGVNLYNKNTICFALTNISKLNNTIRLNVASPFEWCRGWAYESMYQGLNNTYYFNDGRYYATDFNNNNLTFILAHSPCSSMCIKQIELILQELEHKAKWAKSHIIPLKGNYYLIIGPGQR